MKTIALAILAVSAVVLANPTQAKDETDPVLPAPIPTIEAPPVKVHLDDLPTDHFSFVGDDSDNSSNDSNGKNEKSGSGKGKVSKHDDIMSEDEDGGAKGEEEFEEGFQWGCLCQVRSGGRVWRPELYVPCSNHCL